MCVYIFSGTGLYTHVRNNSIFFQSDAIQTIYTYAKLEHDWLTGWDNN